MLRHAEKLQRQGKLDAAIGEYCRIVDEQPRDWSTANLLGDLYVRSGQLERAIEQFIRIADGLSSDGFLPKASALYKKVLKLNPDHEHALRQTSRLAAASDAAATPDGVRELARRQILGGDAEDGLERLRRLLAEDAGQSDAIAELGWTIAEQHRDLGFNVIELVADAAVAGSDWASAAATLQEFVTRVPNHIPALLRLVEICVDAGLEATTVSAQAQLADAYLDAGEAAQARYIAEDLVARERTDANIERLRRGLVLLGERDPDAIIAERLSGPLLSDDLSLETPNPAASERAGGSFELSATTIDVASVLAELDRPPAPVHASSDSVEVDLSIVLGHEAAPATLEGVFEHLRSEASAGNGAEAAYARALALHKDGDIDGCLQALREAARAPQWRFAAASRAGRLLRREGRLAQAIEWLERASQAPAPTPEESHELLYELAESLEAVGESARALAVSLELQADAGTYRDLAARIDRLAKAQARG